MTEPRKTLLLIGATSDIGHATAQAYAKAGWNVQLTARNEEAARRNADDIATRSGVEVGVHRLDVLDLESFAALLDGLPTVPDTVVCVVGELGEQDRAQTDIQFAAKVLRTNFEGPALLLGMLAERFLLRGSGTIFGVSSVAGDRGRRSNYVYGAAKAGFSAFLSGLRSRLSVAGLRVITVKPGFVRTRMTAGMKLPPLLTASPEEVAGAILAADRAGRGRDVLYVRRLWRPIMLAISSVPEPLFKKLPL